MATMTILERRVQRARCPSTYLKAGGNTPAIRGPGSTMSDLHRIHAVLKKRESCSEL